MPAANDVLPAFFLAGDPDEVLVWHGRRVAPAGSGAWNPAFDVTPHDLVTALVTESRVVELSAGQTLDAT